MVSVRYCVSYSSDIAGVKFINTNTALQPSPPLAMSKTGGLSDCPLDNQTLMLLMALLIKRHLAQHLQELPFSCAEAVLDRCQQNSSPHANYLLKKKKQNLKNDSKFMFSLSIQ